MKVFFSIILPMYVFAAFSQVHADSIYYADGQLKAVGSIVNGDKEGEWRYFYPDGKLSSVESYSNGMLQGQSQNFDFNGELISLENWENDLLVDSAFYYRDGELYRKGAYRSGVYSGQWITYYPEGLPQQVGVYRDGLPHGLWKSFDEEGNLTDEGVYSEGLPDGEWRFYEEGELAVFGSYRRGEQVGDWFKVGKRGKVRKIKY